MPFDGFADWNGNDSGGDSRPRQELGEALAALQREADMVAHDINNLLGVILAANEALAAELPEGSQGHGLAVMSLDAAERGADLLRRLGGVHRPHVEGPSLVEGGEAVRSAGRLAEASAPRGVAVMIETGIEPLCVSVDRASLDSALLNLCVNAGHAMPSGGAITLSAEPVAMDAAAAACLGLPAGRYVALLVADSGLGMTPEVLARACEPYFTTRAGRGGAGLGLASVREFAARAGGALGLVSTPGAGTTATLYLPRL